jgi:multiple sugar transport system substrate-binding protein
MKIRLPKSLHRLKFIKILGLIFTVLIVIKLVFACTNQFTKPVKLFFVVTQREAPYWQTLINQFNHENPNIKIELANDADKNRQNPKTSDEVRKVYRDNFEGKSPLYDLIYMDIIWVPEFAQNGWLMDLTEKFSPDELKAFIDSEVEYGYHDGKLYRIPFRYYPDLLKMVENSIARPAIPQYAEASRILQKHLIKALNPDNNDFEQTMKNAATVTEKLLSKIHNYQK